MNTLNNYNIFRKFGEEWTVSQDAVIELESFTSLMYGETRITSLNLLRSKMLKKMVGKYQSLNLKSAVDLSKLPPCFDYVLSHIHRTNYRLAMYKRADQPSVEAPKPFDE